MEARHQRASFACNDQVPSQGGRPSGQAMKHPGARAAQQAGRALTANAVTAVVAMLIVSPFTDESGLEAQLQGPPPWRFCLKGSDS